MGVERAVYNQFETMDCDGENDLCIHKRKFKLTQAMIDKEKIRKRERQPWEPDYLDQGL